MPVMGKSCRKFGFEPDKRFRKKQQQKESIRRFGIFGMVLEHVRLILLVALVALIALESAETLITAL
jgi:hypothetical protein